MSGRFIAIDWGTTNRRILLIDDGLARDACRDDLGVKAMGGRGYAEEIGRIRTRFGDLPILIAGMAGSDIGWSRVPYTPAAASLASLAESITWIEERTGIVPGVSWQDGPRGDVMRGEEVQILGAAASGALPASAFVCQPGTHAKWAEVKAGELVHFTTAVTGELFALLRSSVVLDGADNGEIVDGPSFREGVVEGARRDLLASVFSARARRQLGTAPDSLAAYVSGMLIGSDAAARLAETVDTDIFVLGEAGLADLYAAAIETLGRQAVLLDSEQAFVAGMAHLWEVLNVRAERV